MTLSNGSKIQATITIPKPTKPILQYSKNGGLLREYENSEEAYRITGIASTHIRECCRGLRKTSGGYCWKFKNE